MIKNCLKCVRSTLSTRLVLGTKCWNKPHHIPFNQHEKDTNFLFLLNRSWPQAVTAIISRFQQDSIIEYRFMMQLLPSDAKAGQKFYLWTPCACCRSFWNSYHIWTGFRLSNWSWFRQSKFLVFGETLRLGMFAWVFSTHPKNFDQFLNAHMN